MNNLTDETINCELIDDKNFAIEPAHNEVIIKKENIDLSSVIELNNVIDDYNILRTNILDNLNMMNNVIEGLKSTIEYGDYSAETLSTFNSLISTSNQSMKILTESYKNIANILLNIYKINQLEPKKEKEDNASKIVNTADLIKRLMTQNDTK